MSVFSKPASSTSDLRGIRRGFAVVSCCAWLVSIIAVIASVLASDAKDAHDALSIEAFVLAVAATSTVGYVGTRMTTRIDDTQWSVNRTDEIIRRHAERS